ncbi:MAG: galactokinase [Chloroflexi bacterium]|nr:galactokinase [Chloroflexota bacterium]
MRFFIHYSREYTVVVESHIAFAERHPELDAIISIILAGGKGTRMQSTDRHKVCFDIAGRPAIVRAIDTYKSCGIAQHVVVVGALAGQVIETVGRYHEGGIFAYQAEQRGTGHATKQGARILADLRYTGAALVVAGDRLLDAQIVERLIAEFRATDSDMAFLVGARSGSELGHVVRDERGAVLGIIEHKDVLARQALGEIRQLALDAMARPGPTEDGVTGLEALAGHLLLTTQPPEGSSPGLRPTAGAALDLAAAARAIMAAAFPDPRKAGLAFGEVWRRAAAGQPLTPEGILALVPPERIVFHLATARNPHLTLPPEAVDRSQEVNQSVYLVKAPALFHALASLGTDNAQGEEYLSDIVNILAQAHENGRPRYRVVAVKVTDPTQVMGFNNPAELLEIENTLRAKAAATVEAGSPLDGACRTVQEWQALFADPTTPDGDLHAQLTYLYGDHPALLQERVVAYVELLRACAETLGPEHRVLLARAPGRMNIMGRHIDHQGGNCNLIAIDREVLLAAALRDDDTMNLSNVRPDQFPPRSFSIGALLAQLTWDDWLSLVNSEPVRQMVAQAGGDWAQYIRAAVLRLQKHYPQVKLRGLDVVVHGTVPVAAGLSSSSALVVATAEAVTALNGLDVRPRQLVDLCGEGEWFVGTRGGAADHAAMKFGRRDAVINVGFFPFGVGQAVPFPAGHRMVFCNSHIKAQKAAGGRQIFNQRIACYRIGVQLIKRLYPQYAPLITHLRDVNIRNLPIRLVDLYRMLLKLPERATAAELAESLPPDILQPLIGSRPNPDARYPVRGVVLFGLAECERSRLAPQLLAAGDLAGFGRFMRISHDGDRVAAHDADWRSYPAVGPSSNAYLLDLMADLESGEPERVLAAQLHQQPGAYACSTPELDLIVDVALRTEGVIGAQLAGAGLGGGAMALVRDDCVGELEKQLIRRYYEPAGLEPAVLSCVPIAGSGVLTVNRV